MISFENSNGFEMTWIFIPSGRGIFLLAFSSSVGKLKIMNRFVIKNSSIENLLIFIVGLLFVSPPAFSQNTPRTSVSLIYEAIAATNATLWLAEDAKLFEKSGVHLGGLRV